MSSRAALTSEVAVAGTNGQRVARERPAGDKESYLRKEEEEETFRLFALPKKSTCADMEFFNPLDIITTKVQVNVYVRRSCHGYFHLHRFPNAQLDTSMSALAPIMNFLGVTKQLGIQGKVQFILYQK